MEVLPTVESPKTTILQRRISGGGVQSMANGSSEVRLPVLASNPPPRPPNGAAPLGPTSGARGANGSIALSVLKARTPGPASGRGQNQSPEAS